MSNHILTPTLANYASEKSPSEPLNDENARIASYIISEVSSRRSVIRLLSIKDMPLSICSTSSEDMGKFGIGLELYFFLIKQLCILFGILSLISIYPLYSNYIGKGFHSTFQLQRYTYFTLANQEGTDIYETNLQKALKNIGIAESNLDKLWAVDFAGNFIFLIFMLQYAYQSHKAIAKFDGDHCHLSNYALEVDGFPPMIKEDQVREYFTFYGEIKEIYMSRIYFGKLSEYKKIYELAYDIDINKKSGKFRMLHSTTLVEYINKKYVKNLKHDELMVDKVYVLFNLVENREKCLSIHNKEQRKLFCCKNRRRKQRGNTIFRLKVRPAPNPLDIIWKNSEFRNFDLVKVRVPLFLSTSIIIFISFLLVYVIKANYNTKSLSLNCSKLSVFGDYSLNQAKTLYKTQDEIDCYCKQKSVRILEVGSEIGDFCKDYIKSFSISLSLNLFVSICIVIGNMFLRGLINKIGKYGRFRRKTDKLNYILVAMLITTFYNTALISLISSMKSPSGISSLRGKYTDISRDWYEDVGNSITVTMLLSIFSPHAVGLILKKPYDAFKKKLSIKFTKSQYRLDKVLVGSSFDLANNLSQVLNVVFTSYLYSAGIPLLNVTCFCTLLFVYWCSKIKILKFCRIPPDYSSDVNKLVVLLMPLAVVFHCIFAIFAYGSSEIFPIGYSQEHQDSVVIPKSVSFFQRLSSKAGIANIIMIIFSFTCIFIAKNLKKMMEKFCKSNKIFHRTAEENAYTLESLIESGKIRGLMSYSIYKNPKYKEVILALDALARINENILTEPLDNLEENSNNNNASIKSNSN